MTDMAFIGRVIATVRGWREYSASLERMLALGGGDREDALFDVPVSPALRWWTEIFALVRDIATRRYPAHVLSYDRLLDDPEREISTVLRWLGGGDLSPAVAAVDARLRTHTGGVPAADPALDPCHVAVFDELYDHFHTGRDLSPGFVELLNRTDQELRPQLLAARSMARDALIQRLATPAAS